MRRRMNLKKVHRLALPCSKKLSAIEAFIAKFTFCGMSLVATATATALILDTTTPTTLPLSSSKGPPLLPGCTGAEIGRWRVSSPRTAVAGA